jgi:branched-chain amino acid transport system ATP-binding protein
MTSTNRPHTQDAALETKELLKQFASVKAINYLSISLPREGITSIIGPNGSGKSTLINMLSGTLPIDGGLVIIDGIAMKAILPYHSPSNGVTRTFQEVRLFNQMTVLDNILVVLTKRGVLKSLFEPMRPVYRQRAQDLLESVGLWEKRNELVGNLSYGQRKLLEIIRALALDVNIYLFDEPFAGLFPAMLQRVTHLLEDLEQQGKTIIFIEHNMDLIRQLSDYTFVLDSGELLAEGPVQDVLSRPEVIEAYLGT